MLTKKQSPRIFNCRVHRQTNIWETKFIGPNKLQMRMQCQYSTNDNFRAVTRSLSILLNICMHGRSRELNTHRRTPTFFPSRHLEEDIPFMCTPFFTFGLYLPFGQCWSSRRFFPRKERHAKKDDGKWRPMNFSSSFVVEKRSGKGEREVKCPAWLVVAQKANDRWRKSGIHK